MKKHSNFNSMFGKAEANGIITNNTKRNVRLKRPINIIMLCMMMLAATAFFGCVKKYDCDCEQTGTFVYLKDTYMLCEKCSGSNKKIVAHFVNDDNKDYVYVIRGDVPSKFHSHDTIRVNVCLKNDCNRIHHPIDDGRSYIYTLKCIEKE